MVQLHIPVMLEELRNVARDLQQQQPIERYFDGTFGRGGHLRHLVEEFQIPSALAYDQDADAIAYGEKEFAPWVAEKRLQLKQENFFDFDAATEGLFDLMLVDLGVSSPQLDQAERGFSFYHDGPLDMRMNRSLPFTAADIVNAYDEHELVALFQQYGEIPKPYRVVRAIVNDRKTKAFQNTRDLAGMIERIDGWRKKGQHPATQYFLALRMKVNNELGVVEHGLEKLILGLKPKGRLAVLTFHSLEDRIVKNKFKDLVELGFPLTKKVIKPTREETLRNSRARSALLRVFVRHDSESQSQEN